MKSETEGDRVLITGAAGFTGSALFSFLKSETNDEIFCVDRSGDNQCDLTDKEQLFHLIQKIKPTQIYHLVGSFTNDFEIDYSINVLTTKNIFDAVLECKLNSRVLVVGSAAEYGAVSDGPVVETEELQPLNVYGLTKVFQTQIMTFYNRVYGVDAVMARSFNLYGEGVSRNLRAGKIQEQVEQCIAEKTNRIAIDDLSVERDFLHISAAVRYYHRIMHFGVSGEVYNVGSGIPRTAQELVLEMLREAQVSSDGITFVEEGQKNKISKIYADIRKLKKL